MKRLIRRIINWAYGRNIGFEMDELEQAKENISITLHDHIFAHKAEGVTLDDCPSKEELNEAMLIFEDIVRRLDKYK